MDQVDRITGAFERWLDSLDEGFWDDAGDACGILGSLGEAFKAGYDTALKEHP